MYLALLRLGKMLSYVQSHSFYLDWLGWAFCIGIVTFVIVSTLRSKRNTPERQTVTPSPMGSIPTHLLQTKAGRIGKTALAVVLGMAIGWIWKANQDRSIYLQEHEAWKARSAEYQQSYAAWKARQSPWQDITNSDTIKY